MDDAKYIKRSYFNYRAPGRVAAISGFLKNKHFKSKDHVEEALSSLQTYTLHKPIRKKFPRRRVVVAFMDFLYTADLIDYRKYSRVNKGFRYVLVIVDAFSKFLWCISLKKKAGENLRDAFEKFFKTIKRKPKYFWVDAGTEFFNSKVKTLFKKLKINMYHTYSKLKASMAEAFVKKVKVKLARVFTHRKNHIWIDVLPQITANINDSYNRSIKMPPSKVNKQNESEVWHNLYGSLILQTTIAAKFKPLDLVRISRQKIIFEKGYEQNFGLEIFRIKDVRYTAGAPTYKLESLKGEPLESSFYNQDLVKVTGETNTDE